MRYLLDTNAVIALIDGSPRRVREELVRAEAARHVIALSAVSLHELWYGVAKSARQAENTKRLELLLAGGFECLAFDDEDAKTAGYLRGALAKVGNPIGPYDVLIAAQALRRDAVLVTANEGEFARVKGLKWKNWAPNP